MRLTFSGSQVECIWQCHRLSEALEQLQVRAEQRLAFRQRVAVHRPAGGHPEAEIARPAPVLDGERGPGGDDLQ